MKRKMKKAIALLLAGIICVSMYGCSGNTTESVELQKEDAKTTGTGRYVEKTVLEPDGNDGPVQIQELSDGTLVYFDTLWKYVSKDNGETWNKEETNWLYELNEDNYFIDSAIAKDGNILMEYENFSDIENSEVETEQKAKYMLVKPDGEQKELEVDLEGESIYLRDHIFDDNGRLFATIYDNSIYEIDTTNGSTSTFMKVDDNMFYIQCQGKILLCVGYDDIYLYDMESKTRIEDAVLTDFIKSNYGSTEALSELYYNYYAFFGEENVVYIAGEKGLYRHLIGGSSMEQVIDGNTSSFGDPSHGVICARMIKNNEFLVCYSDYKIVKFTYDENISTVPNNSLTVYSLTDNETIRQAISAYQTANPNIFVEYEIGMDGEGVTREDALKSLSTRLVEGSGPDVLVVDDMPLDSYIEKGILMDIRDVVDDIDSKEGLFKNLMEPFYKENSLYAIPAEFQLPVIADNNNSVMADYKAIADNVEQLRKENTDKDLLKVYSARDVMRKFSMVCAPSWKNEDGVLNEEKVKEFLTESKRIYDAQMNGIPEGKQAENAELEENINFNLLNDMAYLTKSAKLLYGTIFTRDQFASAMSIQRNEGFENTGMMPMSGQNANVYIPKTMVGINAVSKNQEEAKLFIETLLGSEVQALMSMGFPVNKKAFEACWTMDENSMGQDGFYMTYGMSDEEGNTVMVDVSWPSDEQIQTLRAWITAANTPYISDSILEEAIYTEGAEYLEGNIDIDAAVSQIRDKISVYIAE